MGLDNAAEAVRIETAEELRKRFWQAYLNLGGRDQAWFDAHVDAVVRAVLQLPPVDRPTIPKFDRSNFLPWGLSPVEIETLIA